MQTVSRIKNLVLTKTLFKVSEKVALMSWNSEKELRMKCKRYSERNALLEDILLELNSRGMKTYASCKGHPETNGYVAFMVPKDQEDFANQLCTRVLRNGHARVYVHEGCSLFRGIAISIYFNASDRNQVLPFLQECIQNPTQEMSSYMSEAFRLCHIQEEVHDDLSYGFQMYPGKEGILLSPSHKFMYFSLERRISLEQLFRVCMHIDEFTAKTKGIFLKEDALASSLQELNEKLVKDIENPSMKPVDYYVGFQEPDILELMRAVEFYPGYLSDLISRNRNRTIKREELRHIKRFNTEPGFYLLLLKLEESLSVKRKKSLQAKKYVL